jgi:hypothetical protein
MPSGSQKSQRSRLARTISGILPATLLMLLTVLAPGGLHAQEDVSLTLSGGEVVGKVKGQGKASVVATVENNGSRYLKGIRIAAAYNVVDENPGAEGQWYVHEFVFEPPLKPGGQSTLRFSDNSAAEYVALELRRVVYAPGISYKGVVGKQQDPLLEEDGVTYMSTRDFMSLIGGKLNFDSKTGYLELTRDGVSVRVRKGRQTARVGDEDVKLEHPPLEIDSRSYIAVEETAALFGLSSSENKDENLIDLSL